MGDALIIIGQKWREMRSTLSPAFTSSKMRVMFEFVTECAEQLSNYLMEEMKESENKGNIHLVEIGFRLLINTFFSNKNCLFISGKGLVEVELKDLFTRYSTDVIASCAFGIEVNSYKDKNNEFFTNGKESIRFTKTSMFGMLVLSFPPLINVGNYLINLYTSVHIYIRVKYYRSNIGTLALFDAVSPGNY